MKQIRFIDLTEVKNIHKGQIEEHGGLCGIRDEGLLLSAINMPKAIFSNVYLHKDIFEMSAAYSYHLIKNHPFLDGNKRTGILVAMIFLQVNGIVVKFEKDDLYHLSIQIASSNITKQQIAKIFKAHVFCN